MDWIRSAARNLSRIYTHFRAYRWYFVAVVVLSIVYSLLAGIGLAGFIPIFKLAEKGAQDLSRVGEAFRITSDYNLF